MRIIELFIVDFPVIFSKAQQVGGVINAICIRRFNSYLALDEAWLSATVLIGCACVDLFCVQLDPIVSLWYVRLLQLTLTAASVR